METIRRKICIEKSRNRNKSLLPFIQYNEVCNDLIPVTDEASNWGNFTADLLNYTFTGVVMSPETTIHNKNWEWSGIDDKAGKRIRTRDMLRRYNALLEILRNGVFAERLKDEGCGTGTEEAYRPLINNSATTEDLILLCTPADIGFFERSKSGIYRQIKGDEKLNVQYVNFIDDVETYNRLGGIDFIKAVNLILEADFTNDLAIPYIDVSLMLTSQLAEIGVMTEYDDGEDYDYDPETGVLKPFRSEVEFEVNSKLDYMKYPDLAMGDDEPLDGIYRTFSNGGGQLYKFTYNDGVWASEAVYGLNLICADGEYVAPKDNTRYKTITIQATFVSTLKGVNPSNGDYYYYLVRYDNSETSPLKIPYLTIKEGAYYNVHKEDDTHFRADAILSIDKTDDSIEFEYVLQGKFDQNNNYMNGSGILYKEKYNYSPCIEKEAVIDGVNVTVYCEHIDFDSSKEEIYNSDYNLTREGNIGEIVEMNLEDVWGVGCLEGGETPVNAPVFKEEYMMGVAFAPNFDISLEMDRGNAAAFERHFILSECNTYEDLENYRNNMFNIE